MGLLDSWDVACPLPTHPPIYEIWVSVCTEPRCNERPNWEVPKQHFVPSDELWTRRFEIDEEIWAYEIQCIHTKPYSHHGGYETASSPILVPEGAPVRLPEPDVGLGLLVGGIFVAFLWWRRKIVAARAARSVRS